MLMINDFIKECYENAKAHGWHDKPRTLGETLALIHSEWSEALEEYRSGNPLVYCEANPKCEFIRDAAGEKNCRICQNCGFGHLLHGEMKKPEGQLTELVDGIIRIFDFIGEMGMHPDADTIDDVIQEWFMTTAWEFDEDAEEFTLKRFPEIIAELHRLTAKRHLMCAVSLAMYYIKKNGGDVEELLKAKHRYNKTRGYRHGNKIV